MQRQFRVGLGVALGLGLVWSGCAQQSNSDVQRASDATGVTTTGGSADAGSSTAGSTSTGKAGTGGNPANSTTAGTGGVNASAGTATAGTATSAGSNAGGAGNEAPSGGAGGEGGADSGCNAPSDCDDGNPCTTDNCLLRHCSYTSNTTACDDDKDPCTADICAVGACTHPDNKTCECKKDADCDDKNVCTDEHCTANKCSHTANTAPCADDGMSCTTDVCAASACTHKDNGSCGAGTAFTVDNFNSDADWLAAKTTPDGRTITVTGTGTTNLEGDADLFVPASVDSSIEFGLASMVGLGKVRVVIKSAQTNTGSMVLVGVWNGAAWTDKPLGNYAAIPTATYATIEVPTADFGQPLANLTKMRLHFVPTGGEKTWQIDEISAAK